MSFLQGFARKQSGMTSVSLLVYICFGAIILVAVLKVLPAYMENMKIQNVLKSVAESSADGSVPSKADIKRALSKRFSIESITAISVKDIKVEKEGRGWLLDASYQKHIELYDNVSLVIDFADGNRVQVPPNQS